MAPRGRAAGLSSAPDVGTSAEPWSVEVERGLVSRAQRGDDEALRRLLDRYADPLFGAVVLPRVGSRAEAEEIVQETLEKAAMGLEDFRYDPAVGLWPWLKRIAIRRIIDRARRRRAAAGMAERYEAEIHTIGPRIDAGAEIAIIEAEERRDREVRLGRSLGVLHDRYRRAIELRVYEERERDECAKELGVSVGTFDVLFHRALAALRKAFQGAL